MTSSIINWVIDKYLSNILEINKEQTKSSIWSGVFEMSNLKIKPDIFISMNLPYFELVHGYVGKMKIKMSLPRFYKYPIKVEIDKLFFHAKQKKLETIKKEQEIKNMENYKNSKLQRFEEFTNELNNLKKESSPGMISEIINNLEININDICVRFDDEISYNLIPFSFGILLKNLKIRTVDKDFKEPNPGVQIPFGEINNKILKMENLSIFFDTYENEGHLLSYEEQILNTENTEVKDEKLKAYLGPILNYYTYCLSETYENIKNPKSHQYLAYNLGFLLKLSMNENLKNGQPQYLVDCEMNKITMSISLVQIKSTMKLLAYQDLNSKYQIGLAKEYYNKVLKEEDQLNYIENYISYYNYKYGVKKNEKQAEKIKVALTQVENQLKYEEIQNMREAAKFKMSHDKQIDEIDAEINKLKGGSGFKLFSKGPNEKNKAKIKELEEKKKKLIEENVDENVKMRLKAENSDSFDNIDLLSGIDDEFVLYKMKVNLPEFIFNINSQGLDQMINMVFKQFNVLGDLRKKGQFFSLFIGDISIEQYQLKDTVYKTLVSTVEQKDDQSDKDEKDEDKKGACYIEFENNPNLEKSDFRLKFRNQKRLIITVNLYSIQYIINKILSSLATTISKFGSERYIGSGEIQDLIKSGFDVNYYTGGFQHFNIDLDIVTKSPIIIFPQDILDKDNKKCIFVRCGDFEMSSILPQRQDVNINYAEITDKSKLFDIYAARVRGFCMATLDYFNGDLSELANIKGNNIIEDIVVGFTFEKMFEEKNTHFEKMKIFLTLGKCEFNIRDAQLVFFIELLDKMQKCNKILEFNLEKKTKLEEEEAKQEKEDKEKENIDNREKKEKEEKEDKEKRLLEEKKEQEEIEKLNKLVGKKSEREEEEKLKKEREEEKKKKEEEIKKRDFDSNYLIFNFALEKIKICLMKSVSKSEREILSQNSSIDKIKEYKDFIFFELNKFELGVITTEKGNISLDLSILSMSIEDSETIITDPAEPNGIPLVNEQFKYMLLMISNMKGIDIVSMSKMSKGSIGSFSEDGSIMIDNDDEGFIKEKSKIKDKDKIKDEKFLVMKYFMNSNQNVQNIDIILQNIRICFAMSTMARIYQFYNYYFGMYLQSVEDTILDLAKMERKHKKEIFSSQLRLSKYSRSISNTTIDSELESEDGNDSIIGDLDEDKKIFNNNFYNNLKSDLKIENENDNIINTSSKKDENNIDDLIEKEAEAQMNEESKKLKTIHNKSKININIKVKETFILFPLDDTKKRTKLLRFRFLSFCKIKLDSEFDTIFDGNNLLVRTNYQSNNMKLSLKCLDTEFSIANFRNEKYYIENICDRMIQGFRFQTNINSFLLLPHKEKSVMAIKVNLEPVIFNIGFRQTKAIIKFMPKLTKFLEEMNKQYQDPIKELEKIGEIKDEELNENIINENLINEENNLNLNKIVSDESLSSLLSVEEEKEKKKEMDKKLAEQYKIKMMLKRKKELKRIEEEKKKLEKEEKKPTTNIDNINNMIDVKVTLEKSSIRFLDDSGRYLIHLLDIETSQTLIQYIQNSNSDSVENISNLILESISRKQVPLSDYDINELGMYVEMVFNIAINFYNDRINEWEPILEKYSGSVKLDQIASFSRMRIDYLSEDIFNLNISISSMSVLNRVLKKFSQDEEEWDKNNLELGEDVGKNTDDKIAIQFINLTGLAIESKLDAEDYFEKYIKQKQENIISQSSFNDNSKYILNENTLNNKTSRQIKKQKVKKYYRYLPETQIKIRKDKFNFRIKGYCPVTNIDFSTNYTTTYIIKKYLNDNSSKENKNIKNDDAKIDNDLKEILLTNNEENLNLISTSSKENNNINNYIGDDLEILVKIRQNGTLKSIVFESNIFFFNNLQIPISLSLISNNDFIKKYNSSDNEIDHQNNNNKITIKSGMRKSIPIPFIKNKYRIYISFLNEKKPEDNKYSLLYENFDLLKQNMNDFVKYNEENSTTYKGEKYTVLNDYYSKLITINQKTKNFYISSNLIIQRGINDDNIKSDSNFKYTDSLRLTSNNLESLLQSNESLNAKKTFSYLFILDESFVIENQIPFNLKCSLTGSTTKEVTIRPLKNKKFLDIDESKSQLKLSLKYHDYNFSSDNLELSELKENKENKDKNELIVKLYQEGKEDKTKYLELNIKVEENLNNLDQAYEREYDYNLETFQKKKKLIIYSKCIVVNKTDWLLYMKDEEIKEKNFSFDNYNGKILQKSINLLNTKNTKQAFRLKSEKSSWSKKFNINTIGNTGVISLEIEDEKDKKNITLLDLGITFPTSWYFVNSNLIIIEPRFLFVNKFGFDIKYKQYNSKLKKSENDVNKSFEEKEIKNEENINLLLLKQEKNKKKMIQIKFEESEFYSCPFDLEEMGNVDVKIPINDKMRNILEKENKKISKKIKEWKLNEKIKMQNLGQNLEDDDKEEEKESSENDDEEEINTENNINNEKNNIINEKKEKKKEKEKEQKKN